jgi:hypothetical protein
MALDFTVLCLLQEGIENWLCLVQHESQYIMALDCTVLCLLQEGIENWLCLVQHESQYSTSVVGTLNADGTKDHGLFQVRFCTHWWSKPVHRIITFYTNIIIHV